MTDRRKKLLELLETSGRQLHALLYRLTLRTDAAEELLQELTLRLLQSSGFARAEFAEGYAVRAAINLAFDWRRKRRRIETSDFAGIIADDRAMHAPSRMEQNEEFNLLLSSLDILSAAQREVVVLHFLDEKPFDEIARHVKRTPHQVRALCQKGLQKLRTIHADPTEQPLIENSGSDNEMRHEST